ncbi:MAG: class I SAM-dependent methyltransferase, partial [Planctomycetota bacterium]
MDKEPPVPGAAASVGRFSAEAVTVHPIQLPGTPRLELLGPREPEALVDEIDPVEFERDDKMPYWAELWPAARALARYVLEGAGGLNLAGHDVLELGCGLGLPGIAAALAGARSVLLTDYYEEALQFADVNAERASVADRVRTGYLDWRRPDLPRAYDRILGADLLFERKNQPILLEVLRHVLAPRGVLLLADPLRQTAEGFDALAREAGYRFETVTKLEVPPAKVAIYALTRA